MTSSPDQRGQIDTYIRTLDYDPREVLSVQPDGSTESQPVKERKPAGNAVIITTKTQHTLRKNLSEVAILRPTSGVVYPGALVIADRDLMEGKPAPLALPRGPVTISADLPGLRNAERVVQDPTNSSVQNAITEILEEWNTVPASQGYVNAARSYLEVKTAHSSQQVALELGFSAKWASGNVSSQLNVSNRSEASSVIAFYKQVFYTITLDTPDHPSDFFAEDVTVDDVRSSADGKRPPAYVRSVDFGRILMIRMTTTARNTSVKLEAALKQVTGGGVELEGSLDGSFEEIVKNATFNVVAIGGGAQTAASFSGSAEDLKKLKDYIETDATYRRDNPGAPVSYAVAFMKDNQTATMGFTTDYTETESVEYPNGFIKLRHSGAYVAKFDVTWEEPDAQGNYRAMPPWTSGEKTAGYAKQLDLPGDARNVKILGQAATGLVWDPWGEAINLTLNGPTNKCYRIHGTTLDRKWDNEC